MISCYPGDNNTIIKEIQAEMFPHLGDLLFSVPAWRYYEAARFIGVRTELFEKILPFRSTEGIPLHTLWEPYQYLAAWYRRFHDDFGQLPLPFDSTTEYKTYHRDEWCRIFRQEVEKISEQGDVARLLIRMVINEGTEDGASAWQEVKIFLQSAYSLEKEQPLVPDNVDEEE